MLIGPAKLKDLYEDFTLSLDDCVIHCSDRVKNLGVLFDQSLSFESGLLSPQKHY